MECASEKQHLHDLLDYDIEHWDTETLLPLLEASVQIKQQVVRQDPYEKGLRKALNLGHTFGHAFETWCMRNGHPVLHGYAIAWGLVCELIMSHQQVAGKDLMGAVAEQMEHAAGIVGIDRLAQLLPFDPNDGVGRDEHLTGMKLHVVGMHLETRDVERDVAPTERGGMCLVDILETHHLHRDVEACKELATTRAVAG